MHILVDSSIIFNITKMIIVRIIFIICGPNAEKKKNLGNVDFDMLPIW